MGGRRGRFRNPEAAVAISGWLASRAMDVARDGVAPVPCLGLTTLRTGLNPSLQGEGFASCLSFRSGRRALAPSTFSLQPLCEGVEGFGQHGEAVQSAQGGGIADVGKLLLDRERDGMEA